MATVEFDEDEWEPFNDDGFICKRKKRPRLEPTTTTSSSAPPPPDPAAERRNRRERKKRALIKLREKYQREIDQWEHLSNALKALQEKALTTQQRQEWNEEETTSPCDLGVDVPQPSGRQLDELIVRVRVCFSFVWLLGFEELYRFFETLVEFERTQFELVSAR